jgi:hypothetical protein
MAKAGRLKTCEERANLLIGFPFYDVLICLLIWYHDRQQTVLTFQSCIIKVKDLLAYLVLIYYLFDMFVVVTTGHMSVDFSAA